MQDIQSIPRTPNHGPMTSLLIHKLKTHETDTVADDQLAAWAGVACTPKGKGYSALQSAIRYLEREQIVWRRERGAGRIVRVQNGGLVKEVGSRNDHVRRHTRRSMVILNAVDVAAMPENERSAAAVQMAISATVYRATMGATRKRLAEKTTPDVTQDVLRATLAHMLGNGKE